MSERVGKLINTLKINDAEECDFYKMFWGAHARKLHHAMDGLVSLGEEAVNPLTVLCEKDPQVTKWSTVYALRMLIQIGDSAGRQTCKKPFLNPGDILQDGKMDPLPLLLRSLSLLPIDLLFRICVVKLKSLIAFAEFGILDISSFDPKYL